MKKKSTPKFKKLHEAQHEFESESYARERAAASPLRVNQQQKVSDQIQKEQDSKVA